MTSQGMPVTRRRFLTKSLRTAGVCVAAGAAARCIPKGLAANSSVPFAYDIDRLTQIDPKLLMYAEMSRITGLSPEPRRLACGPQGTLYVATREGVDVFNKEGAKISTVVTSAPARCVAAHNDGTLYVGLRTHIEVFDSSFRPLAKWEEPAKKSWLTGLTVGKEDVFAADSACRTIYRYDRSGKLLGRIGEKNAERKIAGLIVPSPYLDVKLGADGLLRVNNPGRHCIEVYTPEGDLEMSWGRPGLAIEAFCGCCNPVGLAMLPDGRCITCEKGVPRVKLYGSDNKLEAVIAGPDQFKGSARSGVINEQSDGVLGGLDATADQFGRIFVLDVWGGTVRVMQRKA